jgi:hypothetical protein
LKGNFHDQFLEGWVGVIPPGYSTLGEKAKRTSLAAYPASKFEEYFFSGKFAQLLCLQRRHVGRTNCGTWGLTNSIRPFSCAARQISEGGGAGTVVCLVQNTVLYGE